MTEAPYSRAISGFRPALPAKGKAAGVHLAISIAIFLAVLYLVIAVWYPQPYFSADGGRQGIQMMLGFFLLAGPLLTFVLFNPAKGRKELLMDISIAALLQMAVLAWGIQTLYTQRPVAVVAFGGTLTSVVAESYERQGVPLDAVQQLDANRPPIIFQRTPAGEELARYQELTNKGVEPQAQTFLYSRFDQNLVRVFADAAAFEWKITSLRPALKGEFRRLREQNGADVVFLPFIGRYGEAVLVISRKGEVLDSLRL